MTSAGDVIFGSHGVRSMSFIAWQAAVKTSVVFESVRICWMKSTAPALAGFSRYALLRPCHAISSARMRLPGPAGSRRAMSIQFLKTRRPETPSFAAEQLMTTEIVRCGYLPANTCATMPPIDVPWMCARSLPSVSRRPATSSAQTSMSYSWIGLSDWP